MMLVGTYENEKFKEHICYIFQLFFSIYSVKFKIVSYGQLPNLGIKESDVIISYGRESPGNYPCHICIHASHLFGPGYLKPSSMPRTPLEYFGDLPVIYRGEPAVEGYLRRENGLIETDIDIIASSFFMLTRYEELLVNVRDRFDRFPADASLAYREGFLQRPIVNEYVELVWNWINWFGSAGMQKDLWKRRDFAVCLTYDVDSLSKYKRWPPMRAIGSWALKYGKPKKSLGVAVDYLKAKINDDPHNTFDYLMGLSEVHKLPSTFYFMSGGKTKYDNRYKIDDVRSICLLQRIKEKGNEIGLHSSFNSYNDAQMLKKEKERLETILGRSVSGVRQHYLRSRIPDSWRAQEEAGLMYATSLSFADHEGFRSGICLPYKPFDVLSGKILNIWELPITVMDGSLFHYQGLSTAEAFERVKNLIDIVKKHRGVFVMLWHNSSFDNFEWPGWKYVYEEILHYLAYQNGVGYLAQRVIQVWETHIGRSLQCV
jgi:hypothetical protein